MRETKTVDVPATTREQVTAITCDRCGAQAPVCNPERETTNWGSALHKFNRTALFREEGWDSSDGGAYVRFWFDICPKCWEDLVQWIGADKMQEEDVDW